MIINNLSTQYKQYNNIHKDIPQTTFAISVASSLLLDDNIRLKMRNTGFQIVFVRGRNLMFR